LEEAGYAPRLVQIDWRRSSGRNASSVARQLQDVYSEYPDPAQVILGGYRLGAVAALYVAARQPKGRTPAGLVLASLPPFFKEELASRSLAQDLLEQGYTKGQIESYRKQSFADIAGRIACRTQLFIGELDDTPTIDFNVAAADMLPDAQLTTGDSPEPEATHPLYYGSAMQAHLPTVEWS